MRRRSFLKTIAGSTALIAVGGLPVRTLADTFTFPKLTILHTNDVHSRIDPFPMDGSKNQGKGGAARRAALIKKVRSEEKNVLLFDSGDIFQGTPYFNKYGGELEFKLMSQMNYDAATMGNHDFDNGLEGFIKQLPNANFPFLCANYDFSETILAGKTQKYKIFEKNDIKIGVFGLGIELKGLVPDNAYQLTKYEDPISVANYIAAFLKHEYKADLVVCLSHLGYTYPNDKISDVVLAQKTSNIDIILGGHTHTFFDKPDVQRNRDGKEVLINQVGWAGLMLGRIDIYFEHNRKNRCMTCENSWVG